MIETRKDKVKDYVIAILLIIIALLIAIIFSKVLMNKNETDINSAASQTRKALDNYFKDLEENGYVLNDFSSSANFDYNLGTVKLFNKDYKISIKNNYSDCSSECKYMYKIFINEKEVVTTTFLKGIRVGVIGNYVAVEESYEDSFKRLLLIRPNDKETVESYKYQGLLDISYKDNEYLLNIKELDCTTSTYNLSTIKYDKNENTFNKSTNKTNETINNNILCK